MGKPALWKPKIESKLKKGPKTFKNLYIEVQKEVNSKEDVSGKRSYNKNFLEAIMYFLNEGEITVSGFDPKINKKRISSFKPDNLILSYVKKEKEDILSVLNEWNPPSKAKIQTAFLNKIRQYETSKNDVWDK